MSFPIGGQETRRGCVTGWMYRARAFCLMSSITASGSPNGGHARPGRIRCARSGSGILTVFRKCVGEHSHGDQGPSRATIRDHEGRPCPQASWQTLPTDLQCQAKTVIVVEESSLPDARSGNLADERHLAALRRRHSLRGLWGEGAMQSIRRGEHAGLPRVASIRHLTCCQQTACGFAPF
jgi:hypothetical protein